MKPRIKSRRHHTTHRSLNRIEHLERREMLNGDPGWLVTYDDIANGESDGDIAINVAGEVASLVGLEAPSWEGTPAPNGSGGLQLTKHAADGTTLWQHDLPTSRNPMWAAVEIDDLGGVVVASNFSGLIDVDPSAAVTSLDSTNGGVYVLRFNADGQLDWAQQMGGEMYRASSIDVDAVGGVYVTGNLTETYNFGGTTLTPTTTYASYATKLTSGGHFEWAVSRANQWAFDITVDDHDALPENWNVYLGSSTAISGGWEAAVVALDSAGQELWSYTSESLNSDLQAVTDLDVNSSGQIFATGVFRGEADFDSVGSGGVLTAGEADDYFVLSLDETGAFLDVLPITANAEYIVEPRIAAMPSGKVYVSGRFGHSLTIDATTLESEGESDAFLAELAADLSVLGTTVVAGQQEQFPGSISASAAGVATIGSFRGDTRFHNGETVAAPANNGVWVQRINPSLNRITGKLFADLDADGVDNDGMAFPSEVTVFADQNNNGLLDAGEVSTRTVGREGGYALGDLPDGSYGIRYQASGGWTATTPASQAIAVAGGQTASNVDFGLWHPHATETIAGASKRVRGFKSGASTAYADLRITEVSGTLLDVNVVVDVDYYIVDQLGLSLGRGAKEFYIDRVGLTGGDLSGSRFNGTIFDDEGLLSIESPLATAPYDGSGDSSGGRYQTPVRDGGIVDTASEYGLSFFDGGDVAGDWWLRILVPESPERHQALINSWALEVTYLVEPQPAAAPTIDSLSASPDPVVLGDPIVLTANNVADANNDVTQVAFYRDADNSGTFDAALDELVAVDTDGTDGWSAAAVTMGLPLGEQLYFAQAKDLTDLVSSAVSASVTIVDEVSGSATDVYVWGIDFQTKTKGKNTDLRVVIDLNRDGNADGIAAASDAGASNIQVTVQLYNSNGTAVGDPLVGTTDANGIFTSVWIRGLGSDLYTAEVQALDLALAGWTWNHDLDNEDDADGDGLPDDMYFFS